MRIKKSQNDVSRLLAGYRMEVVARLDGDPQARRSRADGRGNGLLLATATEAEEQEQAEA